jgi:hypothetical protein
MQGEFNCDTGGPCLFHTNSLVEVGLPARISKDWPEKGETLGTNNRMVNTPLWECCPAAPNLPNSISYRAVAEFKKLMEKGKLGAPEDPAD